MCDLLWSVFISPLWAFLAGFGEDRVVGEEYHYKGAEIRGAVGRSRYVG